MTSSALFTDLYELTMAQVYAAERVDQTAVFELTFRKMPPTATILWLREPAARSPLVTPRAANRISRP
ncbi:MAG TPA: hypothetical protein VIY49_10385 [Bryobacteraceae bacterium]